PFAGSAGLTEATTDADAIERWWTHQPRANIAVATAGLLVVDFDTIDGAGNPWLSGDPERLMDLAAAPLALTPGGGRHYIFRQPQGLALRNTASKLAPKVDTRADGGYILVPPSAVAGKLYRWAGEMRLDDTPIHALPEPPGWLIDMLTADAAGNLTS